MTANADNAQMSLFAYSAARARAEYRRAPPGTRRAKWRAFVMATARAL